MPGLTRQPSVRSKSSELEVASKKADEAIRILRQTAPNEDFTEILVSHWEELKMRYERLKKARAQKAVDNSESAKEEEEKFILPSQTGEGKPEAYILDSILFKKDDPAYNIVITADEIIRFSAASIVKHWDKLEVMESQMPFLDSIMDTAKDKD
ncbi:hypothetical protein H0H93_007873 [Arthromyces matolae]|nr:hypothetical protein H0H93_007873 [Arthromyces matolae]